jgi:hypothetical protein
MLQVREILIGTNPRAVIHGTARNINDALELVPGTVFLYEEDLQNPNHYDVAAICENEVRTFTIEPVK